MNTQEPTIGKCNARLTDGSGNLCQNRAGKGTDHVGFGHCKFHGGASPGGIVHAEKLQAQALMGVRLAEARVVVEGKTQVEQMVEGMNNAAAMAQYYRWMLDELPEEAEWSFERVDGATQSTRYVNVESTGLLGPNHQGDLKLHPFEEAFRYWTNLHAQLFKIAATLGLEERRQNLQAAQVAQVGEAIKALVVGLGRELGDPAVAPVIAASLAAITGGELS